MIKIPCVGPKCGLWDLYMHLFLFALEQSLLLHCYRIFCTTLYYYYSEGWCSWTSYQHFFEGLVQPLKGVWTLEAMNLE
jgi:hypothetical protein